MNDRMTLRQLVELAGVAAAYDGRLAGRLALTSLEGADADAEREDDAAQE